MFEPYPYKKEFSKQLSAVHQSCSLCDSPIIGLDINGEYTDNFEWINDEKVCYDCFDRFHYTHHNIFEYKYDDIDSSTYVFYNIKKQTGYIIISIEHYNINIRNLTKSLTFLEFCEKINNRMIFAKKKYAPLLSLSDFRECLYQAIIDLIKISPINIIFHEGA